jgi:hypothetical protein
MLWSGSSCQAFDQRSAFTKPKPVLACRESSAPDLVVEDPRHVGNRRNVPGGRRCVRGAGSGFPRVRRAPPSGGARCERAPPLVFRPALRSHGAKTCRLVSARVVVRLIWSVQTLDDAAMTANVRWTRPAPEASLAGSAGCSSATCERFTAALVNPQQAGTRTTGAAATTGHISTVDNVSRVSTTRSGGYDPRQAKTTGFGLVNPPRRSKGRQVAKNGPAPRTQRRPPGTFRRLTSRIMPAFLSSPPAQATPTESSSATSSFS